LAVRLAPYFIANSEHGANFLTQELGSTGAASVGPGGVAEPARRG
jgi:hypothetical protein